MVCHKIPERRILVLSDIHYPHADGREILNIINGERPDKLILLGDIATDVDSANEFFQIVKNSGCRDYATISGDEDVITSSARSLKMSLNGRRFIFIHGHQFNVLSEKITGIIASILKKINPTLPVLAFAMVSRIRSRNRASYLILGHSHALGYFPRLRVVCSGCLTNEKNIFNDTGYVVVVSALDGTVRLSLNRTNGEKQVFEI